MVMEVSMEPQVYKLHARKTRLDLMTIIPTIDLISIADKMVRKEHD
jgi:hypothetical protein